MRIVHFEVPADDPGRCMKFYGQAFGWTFNKWDGPMEYWMAVPGVGWSAYFKDTEGNQFGIIQFDQGAK